MHIKICSISANNILHIPSRKMKEYDRSYHNRMKKTIHHMEDYLENVEVIVFQILWTCPDFKSYLVLIFSLIKILFG